MTRRLQLLLHVVLVATVVSTTFLLAPVPWSREVPLATPLPEAGETLLGGVPELPDGSLAADPSRALERAARLLAAGEPGAAASAVTSALGADDPEVRLAARLLLARAALAMGDVGSALELAADLARRAPDDAWAGEAAVVAARALLQAGETEPAVEQLRAARSLLPELAPYVDYWTLDVLVRFGREEEALAAVERIVATAPIRRLAVAALEWRRSRAEQQADAASARATIDRLLELATIPSYRATLLLQRGRAARALGETDAARADFLAAIEAAPESPVAQAALDELDALGFGSVVSAEQRAAIAFAAGRYQTAVAAYTAVLAEDPTRADAWYQRAIARIRSGDLATGLRELAAMAERYPRDGRTPEALVTAGTLTEWSDEATAVVLYERVLAQYPTSRAADEARFRLGLLAYGRGEAAQAAERWRVGAERDDPRALFWYGKALAALGDQAGAREAWARARALDPTGFYGVRAAELASGRAPVAGPGGGASALPDAAYRSWLARLGLSEGEARARLTADPATRRALLLLELGEREAAGWELDVARDALASDAVALVVLGWELLRRGEAAFAYRVGVQLGGRSEVPAEVIAPLLAPLPYPEVLGPVADRFGVDPLLLAALVRQESGFEPTAVSPAGARGLTQVLPDTAAGLAKELGLSEWEPNRLFHPATSLSLGAAELARRLQQFQGQVYLALASYNAGSGAVQQWLRERPADDPDLFAERIPYRETYAYVQRVYAGYRWYEQVYRPNG